MTIRVIPHGLRAFTITDMERMGGAGILAPDERIELIAGDLVPMCAKGNRHETLEIAPTLLWGPTCPEGSAFAQEPGPPRPAQLSRAGLHRLRPHEALRRARGFGRAARGRGGRFLAGLRPAPQVAGLRRLGRARVLGGRRRAPRDPPPQRRDPRRATPRSTSTAPTFAWCPVTRRRSSPSRSTRWRRCRGSGVGLVGPQGLLATHPCHSVHFTVCP